MSDVEKVDSKEGCRDGVDIRTMKSTYIAYVKVVPSHCL